MKQPATSRHPQIVLLLAVLLLVPGYGLGEETGDEKAKGGDALPATGGCDYNSKLPLHVFIIREPLGYGETIDNTLGPWPVEIPRCHSWGVEPIEPVDMKAIAQEIRAKGIQCLNMHGSAENSDLAYLKDIKRLRSLNLGDTQVTDAGLAHLKDLKGLKALKLYRTQVTDAGIVHLKEINGLQELGLWRTQVTDAGLAHLKDIKTLQYLNLEETPVTDAGMVHLKDLKGLKTLYLHDTKVTAAGMAHLKDIKGLQELDLWGTRVTDAGLAHLKDL